MWWSEREWQALTSPERCGMCADAHMESNEHSVLVAATGTSFVRFARNQHHAGYSLVILREHIVDMAELPVTQLAQFWVDVQRAARVIDRVFEPKKIDYLVMGHRMPHLHCHLLPQHEADDPLRNVNIADGPTYLPAGRLASAAMAMQEAWRSREGALDGGVGGTLGDAPSP